MATDLPLVTIGVASYNNAKYIRETLDSVAWQHYPHVELIVVDDCSTDNSVVLIENWIKTSEKEVIFIRHEQNRGICRAANEILTVARGKYFMIVGSDDILLEDKLISQVTQLESLGEEYALSYSDVYMINDVGAPVEEEFHKKHFQKIDGNAFLAVLKQNFIQAPSTLYRTSAVREIGGYDENLSFEDLDVILRLSRSYKVAYNSYINAKYRRISTSLSNKFSVIHLISLLTLLEKHRGFMKEADNLIDKYILDNAEILYRENGKNISIWLMRKWQIDKRPASLLIYIFSLSGISYKTISFLNKIFN